MALHEMTLPGLHDFLAREIVPPRGAGGGRRAIDLGGGSGAWATRLTEAGYETVAVDRNADAFRGDGRFIAADLNAPDFVASASGPYDLVTAIEVIEHIENPIEFLRNLGRLVAPNGTIVLTTPNVDSAPARAKFLLTGRLRAMDQHGDPTHISPVFLWTFVNRWLPLAGLELV
ncbi:MAG: class I SAM-dependent methyltransferase, partial [Acidimicrobiales bacterium]